MQIQELRDRIKATKASHKECRDCPLFDSPMVTVDSNRLDSGPVDVFCRQLHQERFGERQEGWKQGHKEGAKEASYL